MFLPSLFEEEFFDDLFNWPVHRTRRYNNLVFPKLNIYEDGENYYITSEIPGVDKKDLKINVQGRVLTIEGERTKDADEDTDYYRSERPSGLFKRSISLSDNVNVEKIEAQLKNGVLLITLAKTDEYKPKEIAIQ